MIRMMWLTLILCRAGIRDKLNLIETESLSLELRSGSEDDKTAAIDSTKTKELEPLAPKVTTLVRMSHSLSQ